MGWAPPPHIRPVLLLLLSPPTLQLPSPPPLLEETVPLSTVRAETRVGVFAGIAAVRVCAPEPGVCYSLRSHAVFHQGPVLQPTDSGCWVSQSGDPVCCSTWVDDF